MCCHSTYIQHLGSCYNDFDGSFWSFEIMFHIKKVCFRPISMVQAVGP